MHVWCICNYEYKYVACNLRLGEIKTTNTSVMWRRRGLYVCVCKKHEWHKCTSSYLITVSNVTSLVCPLPQRSALTEFKTTVHTMPKHLNLIKQSREV